MHHSWLLSQITENRTKLLETDIYLFIFWAILLFMMSQVLPLQKFKLLLHTLYTTTYCRLWCEYEHRQSHHVLFETIRCSKDLQKFTWHSDVTVPMLFLVVGVTTQQRFLFRL